VTVGATPWIKRDPGETPTPIATVGAAPTNESLSERVGTNLAGSAETKVISYDGRWDLWPCGGCPGSVVLNVHICPVGPPGKLKILPVRNRKNT
jgi:hypothetical protein